MKVQTKEATVEFKPIVLEIVIESKEELDALVLFANKNLTVPRFLYERMFIDKVQESILSSWIGNLWCVLKGKQ